jgi:hypothetical protein
MENKSTKFSKTYKYFDCRVRQVRRLPESRMLAVLFYYLGRLIANRLIRRRLYGFLCKSGDCIVPLPLCMSSSIRASGLPKVVIDSNLSSRLVFIVRPEEDRLLSAYKKKIISCRGYKKNFFAGFLGFSDTSPAEFERVVKRLWETPFVDLHYTLVDDILAKFKKEDSVVLSMERMEDIKAFFENLGISIEKVNSSDLIVEEYDAKNF